MSVLCACACLCVFVYVCARACVRVDVEHIFRPCDTHMARPKHTDGHSAEAKSSSSCLIFRGELYRLRRGTCHFVSIPQALIPATGVFHSHCTPSRVDLSDGMMQHFCSYKCAVSGTPEDAASSSSTYFKFACCYRRCFHARSWVNTIYCK